MVTSKGKVSQKFKCSGRASVGRTNVPEGQVSDRQISGKYQARLRRANVAECRRSKFSGRLSVLDILKCRKDKCRKYRCSRRASVGKASVGRASVIEPTRNMYAYILKPQKLIFEYVL